MQLVKQKLKNVIICELIQIHFSNDDDLMDYHPKRDCKDANGQ
jgi:hypothetical protein